MQDIIMMDIGARTQAFDLFPSRRGRLVATVRAFIEKRRSRRAKLGACACADPGCQLC